MKRKRLKNLSIIMANVKKSVFYILKFILFFISLFFGFISPVYALNVTLEWVPNNESNLAGYRVFYRTENRSYNYESPYWETIDNFCTIYNLDETKTYYFVVRAFNTEGFESGDSNEVILEAATTHSNQPPIAVEDGGGTPAITSPAPGSTLSGSKVTFSWSANGASVTEWWLYLGTNPGRSNIRDSGSLGTSTSITISRLPTDGSTVHLRLYYKTDISLERWDYVDARYTTGN